MGGEVHFSGSDTLYKNVLGCADVGLSAVLDAQLILMFSDIDMAGRENDDNSIELIEAEGQTHEATPPHYNLNVNPVTFSNNVVKNHSETDHDRASLNALKVAFSSLQGYHNDQAKKLYSLQRKYNLLQEYVQNTQGNVDLRFLEDSFPQDQSSMAQAAGAYNESHQDYGNTLLQRELMRNAISNQELQSKNQRISELEKSFRDFMLEKERLLGDVEALSIVLSEKKNEIATKDNDIKQLNQKIALLQSELEHKENLSQKNEHLRQRIDQCERSKLVLEGREHEKDELRTRLKTTEEECQRLCVLYEEQNKNLDAKDKEITRLQSQCKQFEIENSIFRSHRNEGNDFTDSGTNAELEKALERVKKQSTEIKALKHSAEQQQDVIQHLLNNVKQSGNICFLYFHPPPTPFSIFLERKYNILNTGL